MFISEVKRRELAGSGLPVGRSGLPPPGNSDPKPFCARARGLKSPSQLRGSYKHP